MTNLEIISIAIRDHFLMTGKPATAQDIAERVDFSIDTVRKEIRENGFVPPGTDYEPSYRKGHRVQSWSPSKETLRIHCLDLAP